MSANSPQTNGDSGREHDDLGPGRWGAFSYPNYRRYWFASLARVFGIQFRFLGAGWLVAVELVPELRRLGEARAQAGEASREPLASE